MGGQDVLLFVDNIFRFTQAGSEVSALLGRMPSAVGYQPTLCNRDGRPAVCVYHRGFHHLGAGWFTFLPTTPTDPCSGYDVYPTSMRRTVSFPVPSPSLVFTPRGRPAGVHLARSEPAMRRRRALSRLLPASGSFCRTGTKTCRTSLQFWVWTNFPTKKVFEYAGPHKKASMLQQPSCWSVFCWVFFPLCWHIR